MLLTLYVAVAPVALANPPVSPPPQGILPPVTGTSWFTDPNLEVMFWEKPACIIVPDAGSVGGVPLQTNEPFQCFMISRIVKDYPDGFNEIISVDFGAQPVLGVITASHQLTATDGICGHPAVHYPSNVSHRGLEKLDSATVLAPNIVEVSYEETDILVDQVRVLLACQEGRPTETAAH